MFLLIKDDMYNYSRYQSFCSNRSLRAYLIRWIQPQIAPAWPRCGGVFLICWTSPTVQLWDYKTLKLKLAPVLLGVDSGLKTYFHANDCFRADSGT